MFHLVQVNIAFPKFTYEDPRFAGFVDNLDKIYAISDATPGFVWRHVTVDDDAEAKAAFADPTIIFNMSVWESRQSLEAFVYKSDHVHILRQRADWFVPHKGPTMALWWLPAGTLPGIVESKHRLERLAQAGPTQDAFTFRQFFDPPRKKEAHDG
jgi:hypothetical protein